MNHIEGMSIRTYLLIQEHIGLNRYNISLIQQLKALHNKNGLTGNLKILNL